MWGATVTSKRRSVILLTSDLKAVDSIESEEKHSLLISLRQEANGMVKSQQKMKLEGNNHFEYSALSSSKYVKCENRHRIVSPNRFSTLRLYCF